MTTIDGTGSGWVGPDSAPDSSGASAEPDGPPAASPFDALGSWLWVSAVAFAALVTTLFISDGLLRNLYPALLVSGLIWLAAGVRWIIRARNRPRAGWGAWLGDPFPWAVIAVVVVVGLFGRQPGVGFAASRGALEARAEEIIAADDTPDCFRKGDGFTNGASRVGVLLVEIESCLTIGEVRFKTSFRPSSLAIDKAAGRSTDGYVYRSPEARQRPLDGGFCEYTRIDDAFSKFTCFFEGKPD